MAAKRDIVAGVILVGCLTAFPIFASSKYWLGQAILFFIWVGVVTQWSLVLGVAGIFSLAQMLVFAIGGYTSAMLSTHFGWSPWFGLFAGGITAVVLGAAIGASTLRLHGAYVALLTLAMASAVQSLIVVDTACISFENNVCQTLTGGASGLSRLPDFGFREWLGYKHAIVGNYYLALVLMVMGSIFAFILINSPLGHAFRALRDNPVSATSRGINRTKYQILVFSLSAFFTGMLGAFYAGHFRAIGPTVLDIPTLLFLMSAMIIGGADRFWGPFLGVAVLMIFDDMVKEYAEWRMVGVGLFTVVCVITLPNGLVGSFEKIWWKWRKDRQSPMFSR